ncbi:hypothetical protein ACLOJK_034977 [Asimina triloba]
MPADVNVEDFLVDLEANVAGAGPHSGQPNGHDDVKTVLQKHLIIVVVQINW